MLRVPPPRISGLVLAVFVLVAGCAEVARFDSAAHFDDELSRRLGPARAAGVDVPFALDDSLRLLAEERFPGVGGERWRIEKILDFIFRGGIDLTYERLPTRSAVDTYEQRRGNCLSFVNLFVGLARESRLNPFYVEVEDLQRWNYANGLVISHGHIVAGLYVDGKLETYDFLPYRTKAYRDFEPISDLKATAHYYNNLGAEALLDGDLAQAEEALRLAIDLAPDFSKAVNNLGVLLLRTGRSGDAMELFQRGLEEDPDDVGMLTNLARAYQDLGRTAEADALLDRLDAVEHTNPFFFVYRGEVALARGDLDAAQEYMVKAWRRDSELPDVHVGLAKVYFASGNVGKAQHHVERALRLDATHGDARRLAEVLLRGSQEALRAGPQRR